LQNTSAKDHVPKRGRKTKLHLPVEMPERRKKPINSIGTEQCKCPAKKLWQRELPRQQPGRSPGLGVDSALAFDAASSHRLTIFLIFGLEGS